MNKFFLSLLLFVFSFFSEILLGEEATEIEDKAKLPILSKAFAERKVLKLKLSNELEVYIISDPSAEQSAAALSVEAGSWQEPDDARGIAHFLEHMLFLGTKKFPVESDYDRFVTENGGMANAFTTDSFTGYMFSINTPAFPEALDRFSSFFKEPLFNPSGVARELQAIDQEFAKNLDDDDWRLLVVMQDIANPKHPDSKFSFGNTETLTPVSQKTLREWYANHYSSNIMHLIIYSPLPIDTLKELVVKNFGEIQNSQKGLFHSDEPIEDKNLAGHWIDVVPLKNIRTLTFVWEMPTKFAHMNDVKAEHIISSILGDESKTSLLAQLKKENLAESIMAGGMMMGHDYLKFFVQIDLTENGLKNSDVVAERLFQTIANLKEKGIPEYIFDELHHLDQISYQYPSRDSAFETVMTHARGLIYEPLETYPEQTLIVQKYDSAAVKEFIDYLTPQHVQIFLQAKPSETGIKPTKKEKWMGVEYSVKPIAKEKLDAWSKIELNPAIDIPEPNPFIPENLQLVNKEEEQDKTFPHPKPIVDSEAGLVYYAPDKLYLIPEFYSSFEIKSPHIDNGDPSSVVLADLFVKSVVEALNKFSYPAKIAGLNYDIKRTDNFGIAIALSGYSDKSSLLLDEIVLQLKQVKPSEELFKIYQETLLRQYQNFSKEISLEKAKEVIKSALYKDYVTESAKAKAIQEITYKQFNEFVKSLFEQTYIEGMVYGNITEQKALELWDKLNGSLGGKLFPVEKRKRQEVINLPKKDGPYYLQCQTKTQGNAVILAIQNPPFSFKNRAAQQIISQAISQPFYSALRTKQQTGYIVYNWAEEVELQLFSFFADQSNTHDVRDLLSRFELVLESFVQEIATEMPEERFKTIKEALINNLKQPPKNLKTMGELLNYIAFKYQGDFDWINQRIEGLEALTYVEAVDLAKETLKRKNKQRLAVQIRGKIPEFNEFQYSRLNSLRDLQKISTYSKKDLKTIEDSK